MTLAQTSTAPLSILLTEDNPGDVRLFRIALKRYGQPIHLDVATTGEEALERLAAADAALPDLIFLDLKLPGLDGLEVLQRIRHDRRAAALPVFILSGSTTSEEVSRAYELGANGYFGKASCGLDDTLAAAMGLAARVERPKPPPRRGVPPAAAPPTPQFDRSPVDLEQLAYVVSHDLREPLRMVGGFAHVLREEYSDELSADAREYLEFILGGISRMEKLVRDLVLYARLGTSSRPVPTAVDPAVDAALANLHLSVRELRPTLERGPLPVVLGDEGELVQLFQNLLDNALRFHRLRPPAIRIDARREGEGWLFAVRDDGIGVPREHHDKVFQVFFRLPAAGTDPGGTGIGLAVAKRIVESSGGRIWLESQPGEGTTVFFTLPAAEP